MIAYSAARRPEGTGAARRPAAAGRAAPARHPAGSRALTCLREAVLGLRWFRDRTSPDALARGHGIGRATAYRYLDEVTMVLAAQAPDLHEALERARDEGFSHVILDGKIIPAGRCREKTISVKGEVIDLWYSGKAHERGGNIQAVCAPDGFPLWVSDVEPGSVHDITAARIDIDTRTRNALQRSLRCLGERGFALLTQRWRVLQHITASPSRIGDIARAALVLTPIRARLHHIISLRSPP